MADIQGSFLDIHRNRVFVEVVDVDGTKGARVSVEPEGGEKKEVMLLNEFDSNQMVRILKEFVHELQRDRPFEGHGGLSAREFEERYG